MPTSMSLRFAATICLVLSGPVTAAPAGAALPAPDRVVVVVEDGNVRMTSALRPGGHRFVVRSRGSQEDVQLARPRRGYTVQEYRRDMARIHGSVDRAARAAERRVNDNVRFQGGVVVESGQRGVFWQTVSRGRLWVTSQTSAPKVHEVRVSGRKRRTSPTPVSATLTVAEGSVAAPLTMPARGVLGFRNGGTVPHMVGLAKLAEGRTAADVAAYLDAMLDVDAAAGSAELVSPFDDSVFGAATTSVHPGGAMSMHYALPPGEYVAVCVVHDVATRDFHIQHGELTAVTLT